MIKAIVVAYGEDGEIGARGDLPWGRKLPADLANFKRLTTGSTIIMGRKTFESIGSEPLPNRENIVVSSRPTGIAGVLTAVDLVSAYSLARYPIFIIGGASVYNGSLGDVDVIYATEVQAKFPDADIFFHLPEPDQWLEKSRQHHDADDKNAYPFDFVEYHRKK